MDAAGVLDNFKQPPQTLKVLPTSERQVRALADLEPEEQQECWEQAVEVSVVVQVGATIFLEMAPVTSTHDRRLYIL
jgi:diadenosine tetraphosphate (Ap4A) HIT family hydrolase